MSGALESLHDPAGGASAHFRFDRRSAGYHCNAELHFFAFQPSRPRTFARVSDLDRCRFTWLQEGVQWVKSRCGAVAGGLLLALAASHALGAESLEARAQRLLLQLRGEDPAPDAVTRAAQERAELALERAKRAAAEQQSSLPAVQAWHGAALEWALWGRDQLRVAGKEQQAHALEEQMLEARSRLRRARAFLDETEARKGRALTRLKQLEAERAKTDGETNGAQP